MYFDNMINAINKKYNYKKTLIIDFMINEQKELNVNSIENSNYILKQNIYEFSEKEITIDYDNIFGILPFYINSFTESEEVKLPINYDIIFKTIEHISNNGFGFYTVESSLFWSTRGKILRDMLEKRKRYINICIQLPEKIFKTIHIPIYLIGISSEKKDNIFIIDSSYETDFNEVFDKYINNKGSSDIYSGIFVNKNEFKSIKNEYVNIQKNIIVENYKDVKFVRLGEIATSINNLKTIDQVKENILLISRQGSIPEKINSKRFNNYYFIEINEKIVYAKYIEIFLRSSLGKLILQSIQLGATIPYLRKGDLQNIEIPIPELSKQKYVIETNEAFKTLKAKIESIEVELSLNINSALFIRDKLESTINQINSNSIYDKIVFWLREGESQKIEYKETFCMNNSTYINDTNIELSAMKTLVAFLNTNGGTLIVGINDSRQIIGVEKEVNDLFKNSSDKYLLYIKDKIKTKLGIEYFSYIDYKIVEFQKKKLLIFEVEKSSIPCCYNGNDYYIRVNPATEKLIGKQLINYVFERYKH
jgi:hypothetical protein